MTIEISVKAETGMRNAFLPRPLKGAREKIREGWVGVMVIIILLIDKRGTSAGSVRSRP
ncbi:MAG: hypothetical protein AB1611_09935 [bacterium]